MLTYDTQQNTKSSYLDYDPSWWLQQKAAFGLAWDDNPTVKAFEAAELEELGADEDDVRLSPQDVELEAQKEGVKIKNIPANGLTQGQTNFLIERQRRMMERGQILQAGDTGFMGILLPSLAASVADPLFLMTDLMVSRGMGALINVNRARKAAKSAMKAAKVAETAEDMGSISKAFYRARLGALEGTIAGALVEPVSYGLSQRLGDDYDYRDSAANIAMGGAMGAILHPAIGAIGDVFRARKNVKAAEANKFLKDNDLVPSKMTDEKWAYFNELQDVDHELRKVRDLIKRSVQPMGKEALKGSIRSRTLKHLVKRRDELLQKLAPHGKFKKIPYTLGKKGYMQALKAFEAGDVVSYRRGNQTKEIVGVYDGQLNPKGKKASGPYEDAIEVRPFVDEDGNIIWSNALDKLYVRPSKNVVNIKKLEVKQNWPLVVRAKKAQKGYKRQPDMSSDDTVYVDPFDRATQNTELLDEGVFQLLDEQGENFYSGGRDVELRKSTERFSMFDENGNDLNADFPIVARQDTRPVSVQAMNMPMEYRRAFLEYAREQFVRDKDINMEPIQEVFIRKAYEDLDRIDGDIRKLTKEFVPDERYLKRVERLKELETKREGIIYLIDGAHHKGEVVEVQAKDINELIDLINEALDSGDRIDLGLGAREALGFEDMHTGRILGITKQYAFFENGIPVEVDKLFSHMDDIVRTLKTQPRTPRPPIYQAAAQGVEKSIYEDDNPALKEFMDSKERSTPEKDLQDVKESTEAAKVYDKEKYDTEELRQIKEEIKQADAEVEAAEKMYKCMKGGV